MNDELFFSEYATFIEISLCLGENFGGFLLFLSHFSMRKIIW